MAHKNVLLVILALLGGCAQPPPPIETKSQTILARDNGDSLFRPAIYRVTTPLSWRRVDHSPDETIIDTMKANCEFKIEDPHGDIRLTIHTFPINPAHPRIPPQAQIHRWKEQFEELDPLSVQTIAIAHGGFIGLYLQAEGIVKNVVTTVMGWSYQLAPEYERQLVVNRNSLDAYKCADFTIKAVGHPLAINNHQSAIKHFADSFELIDELPPPL